MLHCSIAYKLITDTGLFNQLDRDMWSLARKVILEMVLATDMAKHFDLLGSFRAATCQQTMDFSKFEDRLQTFRIVIKSADLGHAAKDSRLHEKWTNRIVEEFFVQGDREKAAELPVSMFCDRNTTDVPQCQIGFLTTIVRPLYEALNASLDSEQIGEMCIKQVNQNIVNWEEKKQKRERETVTDLDTETSA